jgi:hypothetical protein
MVAKYSGKMSGKTGNRKVPGHGGNRKHSKGVGNRFGKK